jgi:hypothetical protein
LSEESVDKWENIPKEVVSGELTDNIKSLKSAVNPEHIKLRINSLYNKIVKKLNIDGINISNIPQDKQEEFMGTFMKIGSAKEMVDNEI